MFSLHFLTILLLDRYMHTLKLTVGNKACPEGSIAEAYVLNECLTFCSMYLRGVETKFNQPERNYDGADFQEGLSIFRYNGRLLGKADYQYLTQSEWENARLYVLDNCDEIQEFVKYIKLYYFFSLYTHTRTHTYIHIIFF